MLPKKNKYISRNFINRYISESIDLYGGKGESTKLYCMFCTKHTLEDKHCILEMYRKDSYHVFVST